ncbi:MAG: hypothetical protein K6E29_09325 [Cyanobacteria bacterium RUI128]|nr:hypothetical protein [Cyanobacteria bacterium RUI128]
MALTYDFSKVENYKKKTRSKRNKAVAYALPFATMAVGMNDITEKNYKIFYSRLCAFEHLFGPYYYTAGKTTKPAYITLEEVKMFIGLHTNACRLSASEFERFQGKVEAK